MMLRTAAALLAFTLTAAVFSGCGSTASSAAPADATAESTFAASAEGGELEKVKAVGKLVIDDYGHVRGELVTRLDGSDAATEAVVQRGMAVGVRKTARHIFAGQRE